ncbi:N-acetylmuramoyl-L-alanine amidase [Listeria innocua]|uniref:N-acetylmuramoyl-L-alanine amidase n=1 Tax=Listeria innocua TaxID=1642 RepID=UPI001626D99C|nr:N-acetylmuramoyl-L-alanine amidase [Listeria innocua]MBC2132076.1 hypothetical protein [Listeria innocua]
MAKKLKLAVFAGHGGVDSGATGNGYHEDDLALDVVKRTTKVLRGAGHTVINNRTSDVNRNISADAKLANREMVDAVVEIHFDAADPKAEGTTGFYCATSNDGKRLAQCVNDKLDDVFKDRNVKPDTSTRHGRLGILRETNAVATLQEVAFITNKNDVAKYTQRADEVAVKIAEGVLAYFNQTLPTQKKEAEKKGKQWVYALNAMDARVSADWNSKVAFTAYKFQALQVNWDIKRNGFYEVILNGKKGYMKDSYFTTTKPFVTMKTKDTTHFRASANWDSKTAYTLKKGEEISVSKGKETNGFIDCYYRGKKGYIKKSYLK